jgi:hypothetical protein
MNVLYFDGHVDVSGPDAIDPQILEIHDRFWRPQRDPELAIP